MKWEIKEPTHGLPVTAVFDEESGELSLNVHKNQHKAGFTGHQIADAAVWAMIAAHGRFATEGAALRHILSKGAVINGDFVAPEPLAPRRKKRMASAV